ncbi:MAG: NADH dehydrogenase [Planctomycetes bacterium GWF2_50_10]|nr:MAG: NADH dehydrogenase [Planctomycetes bacterium GWF2_50_10]
MAKRSVIPFGPQHPVLPEPLQLKLVMEDEKVVEAIPAIGYVHRGLERLAQEKDYQQVTYLAERVCGICSFIHSLTFCQGIEELMNVTVPDRAKFLRVMWSEMHRMHSHLLWLGLTADAFGFESLFMQGMRTRETILQLMESTAGARIMLGTCTVGGVRRDIESSAFGEINTALDSVARDLDQMAPTILNDYSVRERLVGVGTITAQQAFETGAVGPVAKACGFARDFRTTGYAAYGQLDFKPVTETAGDCFARTQVRFAELYQSVDLIRQCMAKMPAGPIAVPVKGNPDGEIIARTEQPRGEVIYYIKGNGTKNLERLRIRTPTFANIPALLKMLPGCQLTDVPVIILTIDPCISCTER